MAPRITVTQGSVRSGATTTPVVEVVDWVTCVERDVGTLRLGDGLEGKVDEMLRRDGAVDGEALIDFW